MRSAAFCLILWLLAGCSSSAAKRPAEPPATPSEREPWFCQTGIDTEQWECVQDAALVAKPTPTRKPPQPQPPRRRQQTFEADTDARPSAVPAPAPAPQPATASTTTEPTPADPADKPKHVRLSYQPEKPVSILDLPADFWAVQLVALSSAQALEAYVEQHRMRGMSAARLWDGRQMFYVLLLGIYETRALAEEAVTDLPPPFNMHAPWIRSLGSLQRAMLAADEVAAEG